MGSRFLKFDLVLYPQPQEAACNHVLKIGYGAFAGTNERLITVTTRMHIEVDRYPVWYVRMQKFFRMLPLQTSCILSRGLSDRHLLSLWSSDFLQ